MTSTADRTATTDPTAPPFTIADDLDTALRALAEGARPVAGGTDLVVGARQGKSPLPPSLVAIDRIGELGAVSASDTGLRIGATVCHDRLMTDDRITAGPYAALADASALIGSPATRNAGTLGGNVMNGSPAMDTGAPLLAMDATVELRSIGGSRTLPIGELWTAPGRTSAATDELCTAIEIARPAAGSGSAYVRLEYRRAMEIAVVGAAASVTLDTDGSLAAVSVALAAVGPTILAVDEVDALIGRPVDDSTIDEIRAMAAARSTPIDDLRAGADYRRHTVGVMAGRAVAAAARRAAGERIPVPVNRTLGIGAARNEGPATTEGTVAP